jgi:hypothetical protein
VFWSTIKKTDPRLDWVVRPYHPGYAISIYIAVRTVVGLISAAFMPDYTGNAISMEYDATA